VVEILCVNVLSSKTFYSNTINRHCLLRLGGFHNDHPRNTSRPTLWRLEKVAAIAVG
jgi:hypothetical protein